MKCFALIALLPLVTQLFAASAKVADYVPNQTKVALLPVLNLSGETWPEAKEKQAARGDEELHALFDEREFLLVSADVVQKAVHDLSVDLTDEEQQKRETLFKIAERTGADLVAFVVITDVDQRHVQKFFVNSTEGMAKMKIWLLDVRQQKPILSAAAFQGSSKSGGLIEIGEKGSSRKQLAVANGLRKELEGFFKPYPVVKKVVRSKVG